MKALPRGSDVTLLVRSGSGAFVAHVGIPNLAIQTTCPCAGTFKTTLRAMEMMARTPRGALMVCTRDFKIGDSITLTPAACAEIDETMSTAERIAWETAVVYCLRQVGPWPAFT